MKKRLHNLLLAITICFASVSSTAQNRQFVDNTNGLRYEVTSETDCTVILSSRQNKSITADLTLPSIVKFSGIEYTVTGIGEGAFRDFERITSLTISDGISHIGECAFYGCTNLVSVKLPDSIVDIGSSAFHWCESLESITLPKYLTHIESHTFSNSGLVSITIPDGITDIGESAFHNCPLKHVSIPGNVTTIGETAFSDCPLESISISDGVVSIGDRALYGCPLKHIHFPASVIKIGFDNFGSDLSEITVSDNNPIFSSSDGVLYNKDMTTLEKYPTGKTSIQVIVPDNIQVISDEAFKGHGLSSIALPSSLITIGERAFYGCGNLTTISLPSSLSKIGASAFASSALKSIKIPSHVSEIESAVFSGCGELTNISLPSTITHIGENAFNSCASLSHIELPTNLTEIGRYAFEGCPFKELALGAAVSKIASPIFSKCWNLEKVTIAPENPYITFSDGVIYDKERHTVLTAIPSVSSVTIPTSVTKITEGAFQRTRLASISLPNSLIEIQPYAFTECFNLSEIEIPEGVVTIGALAFLYCENLREISLPSTLKELGPHIEGYDILLEGSVFINCYNLNTIYCHAIVPPETNIHHPLFSGLDYSKAILYIPAGTRELYASPSLQWGQFQNIVEMDFSGIDGIEATGPVTVKAVDGRIIVEGADDATVEVYAINGSVVYTGAADTIPTLPHGVYIVRVATTTVKVVM